MRLLHMTKEKVPQKVSEKVKCEENLIGWSKFSSTLEAFKSDPFGINSAAQKWNKTFGKMEQSHKMKESFWKMEHNGAHSL